MTLNSRREEAFGSSQREAKCFNRRRWASLKHCYYRHQNKFEDTHRKRARTLKSHLNVVHSNGSLRFVLFYDVYLQTYFVFESKSTCTTFKWLFLVCAPFQCESSNLFRF